MRHSPGVLRVYAASKIDSKIADSAIALLAKSQFYSSHTGVVVHHPKPSHKYQVKGATGLEEIAVWIEDTATGERVTDTVAKKP